MKIPQRLLRAGLATTAFLSAVLQATAAQDEGKPAPADFSEVAALLDEAIANRAFPGCVAAIGNDSGVLWMRGLGWFDYDKSAPVGIETIYDLASLTKVVGTTATLMRLAAEGKIEVTAPVSQYLPEWPEAGEPGQETWRKELTVEHLLKHTGGLPSWKPFYRSVDSYAELLKAVMATPLEAEPGERYRYSDLGFILLGEIAARAGGQPLANLEQTLVFEPLQMASTRRNPPARLRERIPPTERDPEGDGFIHGVVHDENARAGEGITGHAGLFSTAPDLARLAQELLRGVKGQSSLFPSAISATFTQRTSDDFHRALGWALSSGRGSAGSLFSNRAFGHTGFTGTSIWIDPERNLFVILLTNRVHPTRDNSKISRVRSSLADAAARALADE